MAIARYLGRRFKGRDEETLYPGATDAELTGKMDEIMDMIIDVFEHSYKF